MEEEYLSKYIQDNYIKNYPKEDYVNRQLFLQESYAKFAAKEILKMILSNEGSSYISILESYQDDMNTYMLKSSGDMYMFSVMYDVACDILGFLYALQDNGAVI